MWARESILQQNLLPLCLLLVLEEFVLTSARYNERPARCGHVFCPRVVMVRKEVMTEIAASISPHPSGAHAPQQWNDRVEVPACALSHSAKRDGDGGRVHAIRLRVRRRVHLRRFQQVSRRFFFHQHAPRVANHFPMHSGQ